MSKAEREDVGGREPAEGVALPPPPPAGPAEPLQAAAAAPEAHAEGEPEAEAPTTRDGEKGGEEEAPSTPPPLVAHEEGEGVAPARG